MMREYFNFDFMVTPWLIKVLYVIGQLGVLLWAVVTPFSMAFQRTLGGGSRFDIGRFLIGFLASLAILVLGSLIWRIYCELVIVIFKIHENLIAKKDAPGDSTSD